MLAVGPQVDALFQIVHGIDVIHPVFVHHPQHDDPLQLTHDVLAILGFLLFVGLHSQLIQLVQILGSGQGAVGIVNAFKALQFIGVAAGAFQSLAQHIQHAFTQILAVQHLLALLVDDLTLGVHHVIVFQHALSAAEMAAFHALLGIFHGAGENLGVDGGVILQAHGIHHILDAFHAAAAEQTHQIVLQAQIEAAFTGVALSAGAATELVVDTAAFVALGAYDEQAAGIPNLLSLLSDLCLVLLQQLLIAGTDGQNFGVAGFGVGIGFCQQFIGVVSFTQFAHSQELGIAAQHNVGTTACHVGGDGDGAQLTGLGYDLGFHLMELGIQHVVLDALPFQKLGKNFTALDGNGTHQHRLALFVAGLDLVHDGHILALLVFEHHVGMILAHNGPVGGDLHHVQPVDGAKFLLLGQSGTGHAGQLIIQAEEILEGDGGKGLALVGNGDAFLGFDGLVQAFVIAAAVHQSAGEFVDDDNLTVLDHIVGVLFHQTPGLHGLVDVVGDGGIFGVGQVLYAEIPLCLGNTAGGQGHGAALFVGEVVAVVIVVKLLVLGLGEDLPPQGGHEVVRHLIQLGAFLALAGDDQRGTGLVDKNGVHLVHDGKGVTTLDKLTFVDGHVVTQVVEPQLVVGAVGNVGGVADAALSGGHAGDDQTHGQTHIAVDLAHPFGVTLGKIFVDGDHVDAPAGQGVQIAGQNGDQGLAFAGLHFGDTALVEHHAADQLNGVGLHAQHAPGGFPDGGEGFRQKIVQVFAIGDAVFEFLGLALQSVLAEGGVFVLQG